MDKTLNKNINEWGKKDDNGWLDKVELMRHMRIEPVFLTNITL